MPALDDEGFVTPAAMLCSLGLALVASGMMARSVSILNLSRADLARTQIEYVLSGAQLQAAASVIRGGAGGPYSWTFATDAGWVNAVAEPEGLKLSVAAASQLDGQILQRFGVSDIKALRARLITVAPDPMVDIADLDPAPLWRACAPMMISSFGHQVAFTFAPSSPPKTDSNLPAWRVGEVWRIALTTSEGWRDERIVRFTGDTRHPAAVIARRLTRNHRGEGQCSAVLA